VKGQRHTNHGSSQPSLDVRNHSARPFPLFRLVPPCLPDGDGGDFLLPLDGRFGWKGFSGVGCII